VQWDGNEVSGKVMKPQDMLSSIQVTVNTESHVVKCPCKYFEDSGMLCVHAAAWVTSRGWMSTRSFRTNQDSTQHHMHQYMMSNFHRPVWIES